MQICSPPGRRRCTRWPPWRRLRYGRDVSRRAVRLECRLPASASAHGRPAHGQVDRETACLSSPPATACCVTTMTAPQVRTGCPSFEHDAEVTRPSR
jgi:hypothetical protein